MYCVAGDLVGGRIDFFAIHEVLVDPHHFQNHFRLVNLVRNQGVQHAEQKRAANNDGDRVAMAAKQGRVVDRGFRLGPISCHRTRQLYGSAASGVPAFG